MLLASLAVTICRDCLGSPPAEYLPCWRCGGEVLRVARNEDVADLWIRITFDGIAVRFETEYAPAFRAWLDEVGAE